MRFPRFFWHATVSDSDLSQEGENEEKIGFLQGAVPTIREHARAAGKGGLFMIYGTILNVAILALSVVLFTSAHAQYWGRNAILKKSSYYSPVLDRMDVPTGVKNMNATLFPGPNPSIARQKPNAAADKIWEELELTRTIVISADEVRKLGKDPATVAKFEDDFWGFGDNAYMAQMDVFHQMHCLNNLRQLAYPEYYNFSASNLDHPPLWYIHNNHCIDILYQNIACSATTDLYTMQWMETQSYPFPDFSINHQCRDFEALVDWRKENSVSIDKWIAQTKPEGVTQVPAPDMYYEVFGHEGHHGH